MLLLIDAELLPDELLDESLPEELGTRPPAATDELLLLDDDGTLVPPLLRFGLDLRVVVVWISSVGIGRPLFKRRRRSCSANAAAAPIAIAEAIVIPAIPPGSNPGLTGRLAGTMSVAVPPPVSPPPPDGGGSGGVPSSNILRSLPEPPPPE